MATVSALIDPFCALEKLFQEMRFSFDLDKAVGEQLDAVGVRVGITRLLHTPLDGVYFALDTADVGIDEGFWKGEYDPETGIISLPDDMYRLIIRAKIVANSWDGTIPGAYTAWETVFADTGSLILIQDNQDMSFVIGVASVALNPVLEQLLVEGYIAFKPEGVRVSWYSITTTGGPLFGLDMDSKVIAGLDIGSFGKEITPII